MKHAFRLLVSALMVLFTFACGEEITPEPTPEKPNPGPGPGPSAQTWSVAGSKANTAVILCKVIVP